MKVRMSLVLCCLCLVASTAFAQSQASTGQITGRVVDTSGAVLPGVTVTVTNTQTGLTRSVVTDSEGVYVVALLPPGAYQVVTALSGFQSARLENVAVTVGSRITVNLSLPVGTVTETIDVVAASPVETTSPNSSATLDATAIEKLPINGRRFQDLVVLTPNAQVDTSRGQIALAGQRGINSNISIDGADYNQPFFGGIRGGERSNSSPTIPQESIQEFQVIAAGYSAEFGRSSGGLVNVVTKSGTNSMDGSAFYVNRHRDLATRNVFDQKAAPTQQQFGGGVGGPLQRDRLFYFAAYEQQEIEIPRAVLFDNLVGFAPTATTQEAFDFYRSLEEPFTQTNDAYAILVRGDYQMNSANRLAIRYSGSSNTGKNGSSVGNPLFPTITNALSNNGTEKDRTNTIVGQYTTIPNSRMLGEIRAQYSRETRPRLANALAPNVTTNVGRYGTVNFLPTTQFDWRAQAAGNVTWIAGSHSAKFGAEFNHIFADQTFAFNQFGVFSFSGTNTATILEQMSVAGPTANRFDTSAVTYLRQIGNGLASFTQNEAAVFAQDSWRIRPTFTVNYGIRWEGQWEPSPEANNDLLISRVRGATFPIGRQVDPTQIPDALDQWGPRIGFAWDPKGDARTVVRGFGGVYYARSPALIFAGPLNNFRVPPGDLSVQLPFAVPAANPNKTVSQQLLLIGIDLNTFTLGNLPNITPAQLQQLAQALGLVFDPFGGVQPLMMDQDFKNPRSYQFGVGVERELSPGLSVGAEYAQVKTDFLQRNLDVNLPAPIIRGTDPAQRPFYGLRSGTARPVTTLGQVTVREATARSMFRAMTLRSKVQKKWGQLNAFYTLSKSLSDDDNERDAGGFTYENAFNLGPEYSYARLDRRHQFSGGGVFFLPYDFEVATAFALRSGLPVDASMGADSNEDRGGPDRPYSAPGVPFERNAFRNRAQYDISLHVQKNLRLPNNQNVAVLLDVFNLFNFANILYAGSQTLNYCAGTAPANCGFGDPTNVNFLQLREQSPTSTRVGQYLLNNNPGPPRQVQLGVRFTF